VTRRRIPVESKSAPRPGRGALLEVLAAALRR
jgi:hypothetical protein